MAVINKQMKRILDRSGMEFRTIDTAPIVSRSIVIQKILRPIRLLPRFATFLANKSSLSCLYISISGGFGQLYEVLFIAAARLVESRIVLHHHSYHYLTTKSALTQFLCWAAGPDALHVTQSYGMSSRLQMVYGVNRTLPISNAAIIELKAPVEKPRRSLTCIGYLSNISRSKGVLKFIEVAKYFVVHHPSIRFLLAGPFDTNAIEKIVKKELEGLSNTTYIGAVYGNAKTAFFERIDVLLFPTIYHNETEGIVNHEAMMHCVPVIAYGRGCIPEIVTKEAGLAIDVNVQFLPEAVRMLEHWLHQPEDYERTSTGARAQFLRNQDQYHSNLQVLLESLSNA